MMNTLDYFAFKNPHLFTLSRHEAKQLLDSALVGLVNVEELSTGQLFAFENSLTMLSFDGEKAKDRANIYAQAIANKKDVYSVASPKLLELLEDFNNKAHGIS